MKKIGSLFVPALLVFAGVAFFATNLINKVKTRKEGALVETIVTKTENGVHVENIVGTSKPVSTEDISEATSKAALTKFWIEARINFPVPHVLKYEKANLEPSSIVALKGTGATDGTNLVLVAHNQVMTSNEIGPFLQKVGLGKFEVLPSSEKAVTLPATTNLQAAKLWQLPGKSEDRIVSLVNRRDKTGSYIVIYELPKGKLAASEEFLIALLKEAIAQ